MDLTDSWHVVEICLCAPVHLFPGDLCVGKTLSMLILSPDAYPISIIVHVWISGYMNYDHSSSYLFRKIMLSRVGLKDVHSLNL